jgi:hypothetical protein
MFYNVPITAPAPRATKTSTSPRGTRQAKSYGSWTFATYKEARAFAWSKIFAYPENSYTTRQKGDFWSVIEAPRPKEEKPEPLF